MSADEPVTRPIPLPVTPRAPRAWRAAVATSVTLVLVAATVVGAIGWYRLTREAPAPVTTTAAAPAAVDTPAAATTRAPATSRSPRTTTPRPSRTPTPSAVAAYAGEWSAHGVQITFDRSGRGTADFRTYTPCSMPEPGVACEPDGEPFDAGHGTVRLEAAAGGGLQMRVVTSNDRVGWPVGQVQAVRPVRTGVLHVGSGDRSWGLCRAPASDDLCGA